MRHFKYFIVSTFLTALILSGCASDEEKKRTHFEKGTAYFEKGEFKSARLGVDHFVNEYRNEIAEDGMLEHLYLVKKK